MQTCLGAVETLSICMTYREAYVHRVDHDSKGECGTQALKVLDAKVDTVMSGLANLKLAALPPVDAVVRTAAPTAEAIVERYQQAHDALVAAPIYLRCATCRTVPGKRSDRKST